MFFTFLIDVEKESTTILTLTTEDPGEGFGKIYPAAQASQLEEESDEDEDVPSDVISRKELDKGRLSRDGTLTYQITSLLLQPLINRQRRYTSHFNRPLHYSVWVAQTPLSKHFNV